MWIMNHETGGIFDIDDEELIDRCLKQPRYSEIKSPLKTKNKVAKEIKE